MPPLLRICHTGWLALWVFTATALVSLPMALAGVLDASGNTAFKLTRIWARLVLNAAVTRVRMRGKERIRPGQRYVVIANHRSHFDGPALALSLGIPFRWVAKSELRRIPLFGAALDAARPIFIDRSDPQQSVDSIRKGFERLPRGVSVIFFAEGRRSRSGAIGAFKKGGFMVALQQSLPILPVSISGSRRVLPPGSFAFRPGVISVVVGRPLDTCTYGRSRLDRLMDDTRRAIVAALGTEKTLK